MADVEMPEAAAIQNKTKSKKRKLSQTETSSQNGNPSPKKKVTKPAFTEIEFKVGLRDANTRFSVLDQFVEVAHNYPETGEYDIVEGFCRSSPECVEVLSLLEGEKRKPKELCSIFEVLEVILINVTGRLPKYRHVGLAIVKRVLGGHLGTLFFLLQMQNKTHHIKAGMKLLSAMVMQGETAPRDVLKQVDFQHRVFPSLLNRRDIRDPLDVRTCTLHFMLSFLIVGDKDVITDILEVKGFLNNIFPGLSADKLNALEMVLPTIREKVVQNSEVSKTLKVRLMNQMTLTHLARLYRWNGPKKFTMSDSGKKGGKAEEMVTDEQEKNAAKREDQQRVIEMTHQLLMDLCCDFKLGINFFDKTYGTSGKSINMALTGFLKSLHQPFTSHYLSELVIGVLKACPDQLIFYLPELKATLVPRPTNKWVSAINLLQKVYMSQPIVTPCLSLRDRVPLNKLVTMAIANIIPPKDIWAQILAAIRHKDPVVQHEGLTFFHTTLNRIKATLDFTRQQHNLYTQSELETFASLFKDAMLKVCPEISMFVTCWTRAIKIIGGEMPENRNDAETKEEDGEIEIDVSDVIDKGFQQIDTADHMLTILRSLCEYQAVFPEVFTERFTYFSSLLEGVRVLAGDDNTSSHQVTLVQLHLLRLLAESNLRQITWLKENVSGRSTLYLLLEMIVFTHTNPKMVAIATNLLQKLLSSTGVFHHCESELLVWLQHLVQSASDETQDTVLPFVEKVFSTVLKDPFTYSERVTDMVVEAATLEASSSGGAETGSVTTTSDQIIDSILSMDDVDLRGTTEEIEQRILTETDLTSRFPFSALAPAALKLWKEESPEKDTTQTRVYLSRVLHQVLHTQTDPLPLSLMLQQHDALWVDPIATTLWLKRKTPKKDDQYIEAVESYLTLLQQVLDNVLRLREEEVNEHKNQESKTPPQDEFDLLSVDRRTVDDVFTSLIVIIAQHPDLQEWFLWTKPLAAHKKTARLGSKLRPVVTKAMAAIFALVPDDLVSKVSKDLDRYKIKALQQFRSYTERLSSSSGDVSEGSAEVMVAIKSLKVMLSRSQVIEVTGRLLQLPIKLQSKKQKLTEQGEFMFSLLCHILSLMTSDGSVTQGDPIAMLANSAVSRLSDLAIKTDLPDLDQILYDFVQLCPSFSLEVSDAYFLRCMEAPAGGSKKDKMAAILIAHSTALQDWFQSFWGGLEKEEQRSLLESHTKVIVQYVMALIPAGESSKKALETVRKAYWVPLFTWIQSTEVSGSVDKMDLLTLFTQSLDDSELLETSWTEYLSYLVGASELIEDQVTYAYTLCEALHSQNSALPVWEVYVSSSLSTVVSLLSVKKKKPKQQTRVVVKLILNTLTDVLKKHCTDMTSLAEVVHPVWSQFVKAGLKNLYMEPELLRVLTCLVGSVYIEETKPDVPANVDEEFVMAPMLYQMLMSHSQFLNVMLNTELSPTKEHLVELVYTIAKQDPAGCCQSSAHITALLGAYNASLTYTDQRLLLLMALYESSGCSLDEYKPYLWGQKGIEHHSVKKSLGGSLWNRATSQQVLEALNADRLVMSCLHFPLQRKLVPKDVVSAELVSSREDAYDPCFLLPLLSNLLAPGHMVDCFQFVQTGCLGYLLSALSCHDNGLRGAAYHALQEFFTHAEGSRFPAKDQIVYLLEMVRNSIDEANTKLAPIVTTFLTRATKLMVTPDAPLYLGVNEFLLLKPAMDLVNVPEFYKLFNSSTMEYKTDRAWMLSLLADGLRETSDYRIYEKRYTFKLILSFYNSALSDKYTQKQVLHIVLRAVQQRSVATILIKDHGLLSWISACVHSSRGDEEKQRLLMEIIDTLWQTTLGETTQIRGTKDNKSRRIPLAFSNEVLHLVLQLLHVLQVEDDISTFSSLVSCLSSVLTHLKSTMAGMGVSLNPLHVTISSLDILRLLHTWASLTHNEQQTHDLTACLSDLGCKTDSVIEEPKKKSKHTNNRTSGNVKKSPAPICQYGSNSKDSSSGGVREEEEKSKAHCIRTILEVITYWKPASNTLIESTDAFHADSSHNISTCLYVTSWSLDQLEAHFSSDPALIRRIIGWLHSWVIDPRCTTQSGVLVSDSQGYHRIVSRLLNVLARCTKLTTQQQVVESGVASIFSGTKQWQPYLQDIAVIRTHTTHILDTISANRAEAH